MNRLKSFDAGSLIYCHDETRYKITWGDALSVGYFDHIRRVEESFMSPLISVLVQDKADSHTRNKD